MLGRFEPVAYEILDWDEKPRTNKKIPNTPLPSCLLRGYGFFFIPWTARLFEQRQETGMFINNWR